MTLDLLLYVHTFPVFTVIIKCCGIFSVGLMVSSAGIYSYHRTK